MKKGIKFSLCILGVGIGISLLGWGLVSILKHYGLMFRAWVGITAAVIMVLLGIALSCGIIYTLRKLYSMPVKEPRANIVRKIMSAIGIVVVSLGAGALVIFMLLMWVFAYQPEHVVEKYEQKMVAYVNSFLDISVSYHEYKNFLVCGYKEIGWEWYGAGCSDPFEQDSTPEPINYMYFDVDGNLITKPEEKRSPIQGETDKESETSVFPPENMQCKFDVNTSPNMSYSVDGENWIERDIGYYYQFFFEDTGYLIFCYNKAMQREAAVIYKSVDGGKNWSFVSDTPSDHLLQNTMFFDENTGIFEYGTAGTDNYLLYATTDGANTFIKVELPVDVQGQVDKIEEYLKKS